MIRSTPLCRRIRKNSRISSRFEGLNHEREAAKNEETAEKAVFPAVIGHL